MFRKENIDYEQGNFEKLLASSTNIKKLGDFENIILGFKRSSRTLGSLAGLKQNQKIHWQDNNVFTSNQQIEGK